MTTSGEDPAQESGDGAASEGQLLSDEDDLQGHRPSWARSAATSAILAGRSVCRVGSKRSTRPGHQRHPRTVTPLGPRTHSQRTRDRTRCRPAGDGGSADRRQLLFSDINGRFRPPGGERDGLTIHDTMGVLDRHLADFVDRKALRPLILALPDRERTILWRCDSSRKRRNRKSPNS
jgi:hypothetical protein